CGVLVEEGGAKEFLLFDPCLGLPLPASLGELLAMPEGLKALTVDDKFPYDVTAERVHGSALFLVAPLSALAPRMRWFQAKVADQPGGRAAVKQPDPLAKLTRLQQEAPLSQGKRLPVAVWRPALDVQRRFLPPGEGGTDRAGLRERS